jgi:hypothetical protein
MEINWRPLRVRYANSQRLIHWIIIVVSDNIMKREGDPPGPQI